VVKPRSPERAIPARSGHQAMKPLLSWSGQVAMKAWTFFVEATPRVADLRVQALFAELREEEVRHQRLVLAELEKTPPESALRHQDVADEPVAQ